MTKAILWWLLKYWFWSSSFCEGHLSPDFLYAPDFTVDAHKTTLFSDVVSLYCFLMSKSILWCVLTHRFLGSCSLLSTGKICDFRKLLTVKGYCFRVRSRQRGRLALMRWNAPSQQCYSSFKRKPLKSFRNTWLENTPENVPHNLRKKIVSIRDQEGTMRLKGRLRLSGLSPQATYPVLLSSKHPVVIILLLSSCCYDKHMKTIIRRVLSTFAVPFSKNSGTSVSEMLDVASSNDVLKVKKSCRPTRTSWDGWPAEKE